MLLHSLLLLALVSIVTAGPADGIEPGRRRVELKAVPFPLSAVRLTSGSRLHTQFEANTDWLMNLDVASLACLYTSAANLTCSTQNWPYKCIAGPKQPACTPYHHQAYFGHYLGHYLSATAMAFEGSGNISIQARGAEIVSILGKVQEAFDRSGEPGLVFRTMFVRSRICMQRHRLGQEVTAGATASQCACHSTCCTKYSPACWTSTLVQEMRRR